MHNKHFSRFVGSAWNAKSGYTQMGPLCPVLTIRQRLSIFLRVMLFAIKHRAIFYFDNKPSLLIAAASVATILFALTGNTTAACSTSAAVGVAAVFLIKRQNADAEQPQQAVDRSVDIYPVKFELSRIASLLKDIRNKLPDKDWSVTDVPAKFTPENTDEMLS